MHQGQRPGIYQPRPKGSPASVLAGAGRLGNMPKSDSRAEGPIYGTKADLRDETAFTRTSCAAINSLPRRLPLNAHSCISKPMARSTPAIEPIKALREQATALEA